jgi:hypothetical protein
LSGDIEVTVTLKKVSVGTELDIVRSGLPNVIPSEACYLGWQESLGTWQGSSSPRSINSASGLSQGRLDRFTLADCEIL